MFRPYRTIIRPYTKETWKKGKNINIRLRVYFMWGLHFTYSIQLQILCKYFHGSWNLRKLYFYSMCCSKSFKFRFISNFLLDGIRISTNCTYSLILPKGLIKTCQRHINCKFKKFSTVFIENSFHRWHLSVVCGTPTAARIPETFFFLRSFAAQPFRIYIYTHIYFFHCFQKNCFPCNLFRFHTPIIFLYCLTYGFNV
jgi:hypothetical protein